MKNDEYEIAKNYYRPENAGKIISTLKKIYFSFEDLWRNPEINDAKKMIILGEEKKLEKLLNKNSTNKLNIKLRKNNKENIIENKSSLTI